jgi:uncharacterized protein (DUF433 family)
MNNLWTIREAAAIADIPAKTIRLMIDREGLKLDAGRGQGQKAGHLLSLREMTLLKLLAEFPFSLHKTHKDALEALVRGRKAAIFDWQSEGRDLVLYAGTITVKVDFARLRDLLVRNAEAFIWGQRRIVSDFAVLNGEPVFRGTHIPLAQVTTAILNGAADSYLKEKFPGLNQADLDYARIHARLGKRQGRPRKPLLVRRTAQAA